MENSKKEIVLLHEKNLQSVVNEKTASIQAVVNTLRDENPKLNSELQSPKTDYVELILIFIVALIIGFC